MNRGKVRKVLFMVVLFFLLTSTIIPQASLTAASSKYLDRISGKDRFETAVKTSQKGWRLGADTVILSRHDDYADALVSSTLAYKEDAPILLTSPDSLHSGTQQEIKRLKAKKVYIIGGEKAITSRVPDELEKMGLTVERIGGKDRYETAKLISDELGPSPKAIIAYGQNFPDALAIAPYAARHGIPILLTGKNELPDVTANKIKRNEKNYIIGLEGVISKEVENKIPNSQRIGGEDRYDTSAKILKTLERTQKHIFVATGENFPDALAGASLIAKEDSALLLVKQNELPQTVEKAISDVDASTFTILGGEGAVSEMVEKALLAFIPDAPDAPQVEGEWTADGIQLKWPAVEEVQGYKIYRSMTEAGEVFEVIGNTTQTTYLDSAAKTDRKNVYAVVSVGKELDSAFSNILAVEPDLENTVKITSHTDELVKAETNTITLKGIAAGKDVKEIYYSIFHETTTGKPDKKKVNGLSNWKITDLKLTEGMNRIVVFAENDKGVVTGDEITFDYKYDDDNDDLPFYLEVQSGTDPLNPDSDSDGLPDGYEHFISGTNPKKSDSNENGVLDGEEDHDEDGLTTKEELALRTNPMEKDMDLDGLPDGEEVKVHNTNPNKDDTDDDGLLDGDEILLGFNPLKKDTDNDGVIDSEENVEQVMNEDTLKEILKEDSPVTPAVTVVGPGNLNDSIVVSDESEHIIMNTIPGVVGDPIDLQSMTDFEEATISFKLNDGVPAGKELEDYVVVWFDDTVNKVVPLESEYDEETNTVKAKTDHFSYYFLMDKEEYSKKTDADNPKDRIEKGKADVSFVIDSTGSMGGAIDDVKRNISAFVDGLDGKKVEVRLGLVDYKDIDADGPDSTVNHGWFEDAVSFKSRMNSIYPDGGGDSPESAVDALEEARLMGFEENKAKFIVLVTDVDYHENTRFPGLNSMEEEITRLKDDEIKTSVIAPSYYEWDYRELYKETEGIFADINGDFAKELDKIIDSIGETTNEKVTVRLSTGELVRLDKYPDKSDKDTDSDGDKVPDSEELLDKVSCYLGEGKVGECWTFKSHPKKINSDLDTYEDKEDLEPMKTYKPNIVFLHGWTSDTKKTFGISNGLSGKNNHLDAELTDSLVQKYTSTEKQEVTGKGKKNELYREVIDQYGGVVNALAFNYPNIADPKTSASLLDQYLKNLTAEGVLKKPTSGSKPSVVLVAHSMGGLVSRHFKEKSGQKTVEVDGIITLATPHWGATALSKHCLNFPDAGMCRLSGKTARQLSSPGGQALDPNPTRMFGLIDEKSWTETLNEGFSKGSSKYFAVGGVSTWYSTSVLPALEVRYIEDPEAGPDYEDLAKRRVEEHASWEWYLAPSYYNDDVVSLNSALGSKVNVKGSDSDEVLGFDARYVVIGAKEKANHGNVVNFKHTTNTVNYWLKHELLNKHLGSQLMNKFTVTEPNHLNETY